MSTTTRRVDGSTPAGKISGDLLDRQPPRSIDAERGVIGSLLLVPDTCDDVASLLKAEDFYDEAHQRLYRHMLELHNGGQRIDLMLLVERLKRSSELDLVGGPGYLAEILQSVPTAAHAVYYARLVHEKATLRALIHTSTEILRDAYDESLESRDMLNRAEQKIFGILDDRGGAKLSTIDQVVQDAMARMTARMNNQETIGGLETGFRDYDALTGGLHDGELSILAARPSMGKTALALNVAEHVALAAGHTTLFVSLEMSAIELADRMLCSLARVNGQRLRNGTITNDDRKKIVHEAARLSQAKLFIDDTPNRSMTDISAAARRLRRKEDLRLLVVDYLQLVEPDNPKDSRQEQVARIARRLKGLARELKIPVLCLAQLNRQADDGRPRLSHLRESGSIEQDADVVMFVHRDDYQASEEERAKVAGQAELIVAKQRNGPTGDVPLTWLRDFTRFTDRAPETYSEFDRFGD